MRQETDERFPWNQDERFPDDEVQQEIQQVYAANRAHDWNSSTTMVWALLDGLRREW